MIKPMMRWLPQPTASDVERTRSLGGSNVADLVRLAQYEWDAGGLRRLAAGLVEIQDSTGQAGLQAVRVLLLSNSTARHLKETLIGTGLRHGLRVDVMISEYEDPEVLLERDRDGIAAFGPDIVVLAMDVHAFGLRPAPGNPEVAAAIAERAIDRLRVIRESIASSLKKPVVFQTLTPDPAHVRLHVDRLIPGSHADLVGRFNAGLSEFVKSSGDLVLDVAMLSERIGQEVWYSARHWALAKYPFAPENAPLYAEHLVRLVALKFGKSRRVLVLDLDNTMWGGIVGDDGKENLLLGPGSPVGEAHCALQAMAKELRDRGIVLCVSSKNEESVALDAFRTHPEMVLVEEDIAAFQINWTDKAANLQALSEILSLGLDSFVFLDDNPAERAQIRFALPQVAVPELPKDVTEWIPVFQSACYFEATGFTAEDRDRASYYRADARRTAQLKSFARQEDYLQSLDMELQVNPFDAVGRKRIAQLISKSNQFNLTTRRYSEADVASAEADPRRITMQMRLTDTFGDNGMIGVVIADIGTDALEIDTWLMSCRVLGRGVPEATLDLLVARARELGKGFVRGVYIPTKKNMMVADHYRNLGFELTGKRPGGETAWELSVHGYQDKKPPIRIRDAVGAH
ncbi:haloacid dehalogenase [Bradyrhizobium sp. WBAH10]|nr:haloacid dehalogenase [Bradyrhizobium sp. WBAH30]MDD1542227.1 haloacid dehalogenase [Bradyrhizobium sp. WBAH41]MDD1556379.1 haloacid dehalogenase [Bradyrhizobium sp. WBAH23]MDD1561780.1 haloacid dehalogenase [Bradyrhizobium sp. WBAH33]MDD1589198.1 haloacid dehalogenase [Bradyrhizobium sp. WBAH42]NRB87696.1 haloacid dehalogenase [Bradyrhizobium sp. WBAH10]QCJ92517.1 haloacid dehalogenase [Bradyrhizobium yuanmingense]